MERYAIQLKRIHRYMAKKKTCNKYREILKLHKMLEEAEIPHTLDHLLDGYQILYPITISAPDAEISVIEHFASYGMEEDLLEIMGMLTEEESCSGDCVLGYLTAENVFARIEKHWNESRKFNHVELVNAIWNNCKRCVHMSALPNRPPCSECINRSDNCTGTGNYWVWDKGTEDKPT